MPRLEIPYRRWLGASPTELLASFDLPRNSLGQERFGFDPDFARHVLFWSAMLYRRYFRARSYGLETLPKGPALFVANHGGQLPFDGLMIAMALALDAKPPRLLRAAVDRFVAKLPYVARYFEAAGQYVGHPDNVRQLLREGQSVLVFPEGAAGVTKPFRERYQLRSFGEGFARLAQECSVPVVPVSVVGAEEQYLSVGVIRTLGQHLSLPPLPIVPQWLLGAFAPLPVRYHIDFGAALSPKEVAAPSARDLAELVRERVAKQLQARLARRESLFR